jgi:hypothetical protein
MGCQMNEYDSDYLGQVLVSSNYLPTDNPKQADVILINTCTVRAKAAQKEPGNNSWNHRLLGPARGLQFDAEISRLGSGAGHAKKRPI